MRKIIVGMSFGGNVLSYGAERESSGHAERQREEHATEGDYTANYGRCSSVESLSLRLCILQL